MSLQPCGTLSAYKRHLRHGERACLQCRHAWNTYHKAYMVRKKAEAKAAVEAWNVAYLKAHCVHGNERDDCTSCFRDQAKKRHPAGRAS